MKASALNSPASLFFFLPAAETVVCFGLTQGGELGREPEHRERATTRNSSRERWRNLNKQFQPLRIYSQPHLLHVLLLKSLPKNEKKYKKKVRVEPTVSGPRTHRRHERYFTQTQQTVYIQVSDSVWINRLPSPFS